MDTCNWKWFRYDEIFDIKHGFYNKKPEDNPEGDIPFIGATDSNNGVTSYTDLETIKITSQTGEGKNATIEEKIYKANCITVSNDGSVGYAFYQKVDFTCSHSVNPLYLKKHELNPYIALFLCTIIEKERFRWAYGRKWRPKRMPSSKIKLPVTFDGTPDWQYMENFIKDRIIPLLPLKSQKVWLQTYDTKPQKDKKMILNIDEWKWFRYDEIFDIKKGKRLTKENMTDGNIRYIGAIDSNNGVSAFIGNDKYLHPANTISVSYNGSIGYAFYQDKEFWATDDVNVLYPKFVLNKYIALFLCSLIEKEQYRFCYGRKWDLEMMKSSLIKLPAIKHIVNGKEISEPDWQFMEDYIKTLPYSKNIEPIDPQEQIRVLQQKLALKEHQLEESKKSAQIINYGTINNDNSKHITIK